VLKKEQDILLLQSAVQQLHRCEALHQKTVFVDEKFEGKTVWQGDIEVFDLKGHPKAVRCFAWLHQQAGQPMQPVILLDRWPVSSPQAAIRFAIAFDLPKSPGGAHLAAE
jgi:hypothetical protein